ncbi:3'(2'),5'-bisphosphate nucleotidase CysQ [soil metagenome]
MSQPTHPSAALSELVSIAIAAGREILAVYGQEFEARQKADLSPVTAADEAAEHVILEGLKAMDPLTPVISEEAASGGKIPAVARRFYLVDPLDGTKEFIGRNGEFTVNIALIDDKKPISGVVYAPALGRMFCGEQAAGACETRFDPADPPAAFTWKKLAVRERPHDGVTVVASRSHRDEKTDAYLRTLRVKKLVSAGSSLKFCLLAAGEADLYPRFGRTMEWDTAAGQAVLAAAGGFVHTETGTPLTYGKCERGYDNPPFIAFGSR